MTLEPNCTPTTDEQTLLIEAVRTAPNAVYLRLPGPVDTTPTFGPCLTAAVETILRARLVPFAALAADLTSEIEEMRAEVPPVGPGRVAHLYRIAGLSEARDRLLATLTGPATTTTTTTTTTEET